MLLNYHIRRFVLGLLCVGDLVQLELSSVRVAGFSLQHGHYSNLKIVQKYHEIYTMTIELLLYLALGEITTTEPERTKQHLMIEHDGFLNVLLQCGENLQCVV